MTRARNTILARRVLAVAILAGATLLASTLRAEPIAEERWQDTLRLVREAFPEVRQLATEGFARFLEAGFLEARLLDERAGVVLLDARSKEEFNTSHLQHAVHAEDVQTALNALRGRDEKRIVVVYCSVGYRSSRLANRLRALGVKDVFNLEGSLFKWANEGRPVYRGSQRVRQVHPYDEDWGELLDEPLHSR